MESFATLKREYRHMRVVQVLNHFLPQQTAGTEIYTWALSKQLQQQDVEVKVVIPNYGKQENDAYVYDALPVHQYAEPSVVDRSLIMGFRDPDGLVFFKAYIEEQKPDIVHFHELAGSNGITLQHVQAAKSSGAKVIMTFHLAGYSCKTGTLIYKEEELCNGLINIHKCSRCYLHSKGSGVVNSFLQLISPVFYQLGFNTTRWNHPVGTALGTSFIIEQQKKNFDLLVQQCDQVVAITHWYKKILLLNGVPGQKINYVPQGLPFTASVQPESKNENTGSSLRLLFLGRISHFKGLHLLLEVLLGLPEDQVELDIYGQSGDEVYEKEWRKKTGACKNIHWKGRLQQQEVVNTMKQYDALCLCSTFSEMSPLVIQEAFAANIPIIASDVYGNAEQIRHGENGLLFRFKDAASLKEQLSRCIKEPLLLKQMKKNRTPLKRFKEVGEAYLEIYKKMLGEKPGELQMNSEHQNA